MTNCVHPTIAYQALSQPFNKNDMVQSRFLGIQANTSPLTYAELDNSVDLKCSEPIEFAEDMIRLKNEMHFKILGGCCGTDNLHMEAVASRLYRS
jgi:methionine synthase I (cobalamin-dependent)